LLAASLVIAIGSLVQGGVGFGSLLIAAPLLVLIHPTLVPGPVLVPGLLLSLLMARRDRSGLDLSSVGWAFAGRVPGSVVGALVLAALPAGGFELLVGATVLLGVLVSATSLRIRPTPLTLAVAGFVAGVTGTATSVGGPPVALVYQHHSGDKLRGTLSGFFVMGSVLSMATLALVGRFGAHEALLGLLLVPGTVAGYAVSPPFVRWLDRGYTRAAVLGLSAAAGLVLILRRLV
jgi:uncharacterized membrane protein YfcA